MNADPIVARIERELAAVDVGTVDEALDALMDECPRGHDKEGHRIGFYWHGTARGEPLQCLSDLPAGYPGVVPTWSQLRLFVARRRRQDEQTAVALDKACPQCGQLDRVGRRERLVLRALLEHARDTLDESLATPDDDPEESPS